VGHSRSGGARHGARQSTSAIKKTINHHAVVAPLAPRHAFHSDVGHGVACVRADDVEQTAQVSVIPLLRTPRNWGGSDMGVASHGTYHGRDHTTTRRRGVTHEQQNALQGFLKLCGMSTSLMVCGACEARSASPTTSESMSSRCQVDAAETPRCRRGGCPRRGEGRRGSAGSTLEEGPDARGQDLHEHEHHDPASTRRREAWVYSRKCLTTSVARIRWGVPHAEPPSLRPFWTSNILVRGPFRSTSLLFSKSIEHV